MVAIRSAFAAALVACLSLTGCLVSFNDYPLGGQGGTGGSAAGAGDSNAGAAAITGSTAGDIGAGGSAAGNSAMGGAYSGGWPSAGSPDGGSPGGGSPDGGAPTAGTSQGGAAGGTSPGGAGGAMVQPANPLLDDFEDGDSQVLLVANRNGSWFTANDGTGQQSPDPHAATLPSLLNPPRGLSKRALHTSGSGFTVSGAQVGANFVVVGTTAMPYDISAYKGLTFWAKIGKPGAVGQARVSIRNYDTLYGCTECGDHFGAVVMFGSTFQAIQVPFSTLKQVGWGKPLAPTFQTDRTYAVTFDWAKGQNFDVWIDDLSFY